MSHTHELSKVGCVSPMVIWSEFHIGQYKDGDHLEDASHFISLPVISSLAAIGFKVASQTFTDSLIVGGHDVILSIFVTSSDTSG